MNPIIELLLLILVANGTPVLVSFANRHRPGLAIDHFLPKLNGLPLFGPNKTWRGLVSSVITTTLLAYVIGLQAYIGATIAALVMLGDLGSSFTKRRLGKQSGERMTLLDQLPEVLLPSLFCYQWFGLQLSDIIVICVLFVMIEIVLSLVLYKLGIRKNPW